MQFLSNLFLPVLHILNMKNLKILFIIKKWMFRIIKILLQLAPLLKLQEYWLHSPEFIFPYNKKFISNLLYFIFSKNSIYNKKIIIHFFDNSLIDYIFIILFPAIFILLHYPHISKNSNESNHILNLLFIAK